MNRDQMIENIKADPDHWDLIIIGGGASGLGSAVDAASRGFKTLLLEQSDFAKGTSSRSTKLIHGGLRYLQQGNVSLVTEALKERGLLCQNAPHLIHHLPFLVPSYHWWEGPFYGLGLKVYDMLAGKLGIEPSRTLDKAETLKEIPTLRAEGLRGGVIYYDGQFDDARLAITLAQTAADHGATLINYMKVTGLIKKERLCTGVTTRDMETGKRYTLRAKGVINATGPFVDQVIHFDQPKQKPLIAPSQGIHLVINASFQPGTSAILVPHTQDGRVVFIVPWQNKLLIGTTDTPVKKAHLEPKPLKKEIDFLLKCAAEYLEKAPTKKDILSVFAGIRPLVSSGQKNTASLSRDHTISISKSGLITLTGGKWTTYRKMAEDVIDQAILIADLPTRPTITPDLPLHGKLSGVDPRSHWSRYGTDFKQVQKLGQKKIHPRLPYYESELIWAVRHEMGRTVEDLLSRRTRSLLLDAKASIETAPLAAKILGKELKKNQSWIQEQIKDYVATAKAYCP